MNIIRSSYRTRKVELEFGSPNFTEKVDQTLPGLKHVERDTFCSTNTYQYFVSYFLLLEECFY